MSDEDAFLASIRSHPQDDLRRLVYADWLEERDTDEARVKAEYLRLEVHLVSLPDEHPEREGFILKLRDLAEPLPVEWKSEVAKVQVENCSGRFQCPKTWDQLETTENYTSEVRFCSACHDYVVYCGSILMARNIAETMGHRVVIDLGVRRAEHDMDELQPPPPDYSGNYPGPSELELAFGIGCPSSECEPLPPAPKPPSPKPGLLRRLWRKLTGG